MLNELCLELKNWFDRGQPHKSGEIEIRNGALYTLCDLKPNQYFRIVGSTFNDGVYQFPTTSLTNEIFSGSVWGMAIPKDFLDLVEDIKKFNAKVEDMALVEKGYASESFGVYSYSVSSSAPAMMVEWQNCINRRLNCYRKL